MKIKTLFLGLCVAFLVVLHVQAKNTTTRYDYSKYSSEERPWVWWFWLGNVVSPELIDQHLEAYARSGYGGVTIIATYTATGYDKQAIRYRSPEWFKMIDYTINRAKHLNMGVDLAQTSAWPFGGPQVSSNHGAKALSQCKTFYLEGNSTQTVTQENEFVVAASAFNDEGKYMDLTNSVHDGVLKYTLPSGKWMVKIVTGKYTEQHVKRSSPGGEGLVMDYFSKDAVHEYLNDFDKDVPKLKGIRSMFNDSYEVYSADYTPELIDTFVKYRGYNPKPFLHLLFDTKDSSELKTRFLCDYRATVADLILTNFGKNWTSWSHEHGFITTEQAHGAPSNTLDLYASADIPQCESFGPSCFDIKHVRFDKDTQRTRYKWPDIIYLKFAASAAHVSGKKLASSETATWLTNHFRMALSQVKPEIDKLFVAGINHLHLISSTNTPLNNQYPGWVFYPAPDFGPRSACFDYFPDLSIFIARSQHLLQTSTPDNDILLYYPVFDYFSTTPSDLGVLTMMDHIPTKFGNNYSFSITARNLWKLGYSFDYISDKQIDAIKVENGEMVTSGNAHYKILMLPACNHIPIATLNKIHQLAQAGIKIVFDTRMPNDVPGLNNLSERLAQLNSTCLLLSQYSNVGVSNNIDSLLIADSATKEHFAEHKLEYIRRNLDGGKMYYVANQTNAFSSGFIPLGFDFKGVELYNPMTGELGIPLVKHQKDGLYVYLELLPGQSLIVKGDTPIQTKNKWVYFDKNNPIVIHNSWTIHFEKGELQTPKDVFTKHLVSWTELGDSTNMYYNGTGVYSTTFNCPPSLLKSQRTRLMFDDLRDMAEVSINGTPVGRTWSVPYLVDFDTKLLKSSNNKLEIRVTNIATNRMIWMDKHKIDWQECFVADPKKRSFNTTDWNLEPAGIIGDIQLIGSNH